MNEETQTGDSDAVLTELRDLNRWIQILATPVLRDRLEELLAGANDRKIYQASIGGTQAEVAAAAGVSQPTVSAAWRKWAAAGIVKPTATQGRFVRLVDLEVIGLAVEAPDR